MGWFQAELLSACSEEKNENNQLILQSLASTLLPIFDRVIPILTPVPLPCRFGVVYPDATGGLPIKSEYV